MKTINPVMELLTRPGETTLFLHTDGKSFQIKEDSTGSIGFWNIDPNQPFQRIAIYHSTQVDGKRLGKLYTAFPAGFEEPEVNSVHKGYYSIKLKRLREVGLTEETWEHLCGNKERSFEYITRTKEASVSKIIIEYSDCSYDEIKILQEDDFPLFSLDRKLNTAENISLGAHTSGAIASLLFITSITNQRTEYFSFDPRVGKLLQSWEELEKS